VAQPAPPPPQQSATAPIAKQTESQFGLEYKAHETELGQVRSRIVGHFGGWSPNQHIELENGQVWQIADNTSRYLYLDDPAVTVRRGMMGAFYLDIEGTNHMPRVKRVK
jgi:hypothetical protein